MRQFRKESGNHQDPDTTGLAREVQPGAEIAFVARQQYLAAGSNRRSQNRAVFFA